MPERGYDKLPKVEMVPLPENLHVPSDIPASKIRIPSTYREGTVHYENDEEKEVSENEATHLRLTAKDKRSEIVVGPVAPKGMFKLLVYFDENKRPVSKNKASYSREVILDDDYERVKSKD